MPPANRLWLLSIALTACAGGSAQQPAARASAHAFAQPSSRAASRLGPPSPRGLSLRRIDSTDRERAATRAVLTSCTDDQSGNAAVGGLLGAG